MSVRRVLSDVRAPDELPAQERGWAVIRSAYRDRPPLRQSRRRARLALLPLVAVAVGAVAFSPAGATIARWVKHTLGVKPAASALSALPAPGRLLVSGVHGAWIVSADGSVHELGAWSQASWSPHGLYIAVARGAAVAAVNPHSRLQWSLTRPDAADPSWYPPSGYRVAYLAGHTVRVVAGDGTDDHLLASGVARIAPAWRPGHPYQLAYLTRAGRLVVRDADSRHVVWTAASPRQPTSIAWSDDGNRLLVLTPTRALVFAANGRPAATFAPGGGILDGALAPDGRRLALLAGGHLNRLLMATIPPAGRQPSVVFAGTGLRALAWSPNGSWLLVSWPQANQWVFVRARGRPRISAVSHIAQQFGGRPSHEAFPSLDGWCCVRWPTPQ